MLLAAFLAGCTSQTPSSEEPPDQITIGFPEGNVGGAEVGAGQFANLLSLEGLTFGNIDGRPLPRLAESWAWEKEGRQLRLNLRAGVFLHDGRPFNGENAAAILRENISRPRNRMLQPSLSDIVSVDADGSRQIVVRLSQPNSFLLEDLALQLSTGPQQAIGTGPFRVVKPTDDELELERFERHYQGAPAIRRIKVQPFETLRTAWSSFLRGDVDMVSDVPPDAVEFIRTANVQVLTYRRWYQFMIAFNSGRQRLASPAVRRALNVAIDRDAIIRKVLKGSGSPSTGPLWPSHWAYDETVQPYRFDPGLAVSTLNDQGLRVVPSPNQSAPSARLRFTCLLPANFSLLERLALEVQKQLYDVGVDMQFEVVPFQAYNDRLSRGDFDAVLVDLIAGPGFGRPYIFWRSAAAAKGMNVFGYENGEVERLFQSLRATTNEAGVRSTTGRLQRAFLDDPPALFLAWSERARAVSTRFDTHQEARRDPLLTMGRWTTATTPLIAAR